MRDIVFRILRTDLAKFELKCPPNITDLVFLEIEKNYMEQYKSFVSRKNEATANQSIGKWIKEYWNLKNIGRCNNPVSQLISSYEKHSN